MKPTSSLDKINLIQNTLTGEIGGWKTPLDGIFRMVQGLLMIFMYFITDWYRVNRDKFSDGDTF